MPVLYERTTRTFFLHGPRTTYAIGIGPLDHLLHLYWGPRLRGGDLRGRGSPGMRIFAPNPDPNDRSICFDNLPFEYPTFGRGDFRSPGLGVIFPDGGRVFDLAYARHRISRGKPTLAGLPSTYVERPTEATTLEIDLTDRKSKVTATLLYTVFEQRDAIARSVLVHNRGDQPIELNRVLSASIDLAADDFDFLQLSGAWGRECRLVRQPLRSGIQSIESRRGASSHQQNPFIALLRPHTDESQGEVYGFSLVYSGNFLAQAEVDQDATVRVQIGINPGDFNWRLDPGETFQAPEAVLAFSVEGLNGLSQTYHSLYRVRLARGRWRDRERPVLINNWEATYFNFDSAKLLALARQAKKAGIELFVLDDGWFNRRNDETTSLGDWHVDLKKLPGGLNDLSRRIHKIGLDFGLWFEPEMISPDSDLYRTHPDWCLHVPDRSRTEARSQLVLDLSRPDVCDWILETVSGILASAKIEYVKWDMNRHLTEIGSARLPSERQAETAHRHILGLYDILEKLTSRFPKILFESCSGGGGRFDPGMLHYMPQTWTSDNTDAISRLRIQYGTSLVYPLSAMTAHVSAVPSHQTGRVTSLKTRGDVATAGNLGYELDLTSLDKKENKIVSDQISFYQRHRKLIQFGRFYRLASPFEENRAAWMVVSADKKEALVWNIDILSEVNSPRRFIRLQGLNPKDDYLIAATGEVLGGDVLHWAGLPVPPQSDFQSTLWHLKAAS